jgi:hypothetical protein
MKFTPTKFYAAFADGLLEMTGHAFQAIDRTFVVHHKREPYFPSDKNYLVSDMETGYKVTILPTTNRLTAAHYAIDVLHTYSSALLQDYFRMAAAKRKTLQIIEQDPT